MTSKILNSAARNRFRFGTVMYVLPSVNSVPLYFTLLWPPRNRSYGDFNSIDVCINKSQFKLKICKAVEADLY